MLNLIKAGLKQMLHDLDSGNSIITESEQEELLKLIEKMNSQELSKTQASEFLRVSRATLDNYIVKGIVPEGVKKQGFNNKIWYKSDLSKIHIK